MQFSLQMNISVGTIAQIYCMCESWPLWRYSEKLPVVYFCTLWSTFLQVQTTVTWWRMKDPLHMLKDIFNSYRMLYICSMKRHVLKWKRVMLSKADERRRVILERGWGAVLHPSATLQKVVQIDDFLHSIPPFTPQLFTYRIIVGSILNCAVL